MADDDQDDSQKTEEPTQKRLEEAVRKGQVAFSREVSNFFMLLALTINLVWLAPYVMTGATEALARFIISPDDIPTDMGDLQLLMGKTLGDVALVMALPILATIIAAFASSLVQNKFIFSMEPIIPKLEKISPLKGLKRLFSMRSIVEFIKGLIKIIIVGSVATYAVWPHLHHLNGLPGYETGETVKLLAALVMRLLVGVCAIMGLIALLDYLYQRYEYMKNLRMTKQELRDEYKQQEGDPQIKARLRQIRMERARQRMMAAVPSADVVITNPTHYSIALRYDQETMKAPMVVALGIDAIALRIREVAKEHDVPIVENPPLARALYAAAELDEEIPVEHYQAVAEVISYVYQLKGKLH